MASELRLSAARAFDRACTLSQLPTSAIRYELTRALRSADEAPISRSALEDWRKGRQPVDLETVLAACRLSGATLTMQSDGTLTVHLEEPAARPGLRPVAAGGRLRASFSLMAGGLALAVLMGAAANGWFGRSLVSVADAMQAAAHIVVTAVPGPGPSVGGMVYASSPTPVRHLPSPRAGAGAGPRVLASPTAAPASPPSPTPAPPAVGSSPAPTAPPAASPEPVATPTLAPLPPVTPLPPTPAPPPVSASLGVSLAVAPEPSPTPDPSPTP